VFELGFSSLGAYVVERCERSVRWAEGARALARRLEALPELRRRVAMGNVSWSMAEVLARVATPADEARWLERAECRTVRQVRALVAEASGSGEDEDEDADVRLQCDASEACTLTCTVPREDAWLFEATRCLLEQLGECSPVAQSDALLAEAQSTLLALLPRGVLDLEGMPSGDAKQRCWLEQLRRWHAEAEVLCESDILGGLLSGRAASSEPAPALRSVVIEAALGMASLSQASGMSSGTASGTSRTSSATMLDREVRALSTALARHELELSQLALRLHRADGWRRLGYASEAQYARERLGMSRSSLRARRTLALRLERLPTVAAALAAAHIGVEAALQLVRIATRKTEAAWVMRAQRRTIKHLREEVAAALVAVRHSGEADCRHRPRRSWPRSRSSSRKF
jgi:hypothetical protein